MQSVVKVAICLLAVHGADAVSLRNINVQSGSNLSEAAPQAGFDFSSLGAGLGAGIVVAIVVALVLACAMGIQKAASADIGKEAEEEGEVSEETADEYQTLIKVLAQKVAQEVGPKLSKGAAVSSVLNHRMSQFTNNAKDFMMSEMNCTAGEVLTELDAPETMLLLDWNHAVEANFPPVSILVAGVLSPTVISLMSFHHFLQMVTVGLPVMILCMVAIAIDWSAPCSIPTIFAWLFTQSFLAACLVIGHGALLLKVFLGKRQLAAKAKELEEKGQGEEELANMRDEFVGNTIILQEALLVENGIRTSFWNHIVGLATACWLITTIWNLVLICGWTFVPGVVAFHPKAAEVAKDEYCGAWMTVLVLRVNVLLAVLYLFFNLATVTKWICDIMIESHSFQHSVLEQARKMDKNASGLPVMELLVKAFLLRGGSDTLNSRLSVVQNHKAALEKEAAELEAEKAVLTAELESTAANEKALKAKAVEEGADGQPKNKKLAETIRTQDERAQDFHNWKSQSSGLSPTEVAAAAAEAQAKAQQIQEETQKAIEALWVKIQEAIEAAKNSEMALYLEAQAREAEALIEAKMNEAMETLNDPDFQKKLQEAAANATAQAKDLADQAIEAVKDPEKFKELSDMASQAMEQAQKAAQEVAEAANDPEKRKELQERAQKAMDDAQAAAQQAAALVQDPEMQKKMQEAAQNAMDQAQLAVAVAQAEMGQKLQDAAQKAMDDAKAAAQQAADVVNDPELKKKLEDAAKKAMEDAQAAAEQAKAAAQDPELQKKLEEAAGKFAEERHFSGTSPAASCSGTAPSSTGAPIGGGTAPSSTGAPIGENAKDAAAPKNA